MKGRQKMIIQNYEQNMRRAYEAINSIGKTTKSTEKQALLEQQHDNVALKTFLGLTYNPYLQYYIKKIPKVKTSASLQSDEAHWAKFLSMLVKLNARTLSGNAALETCQSILSECSLEEQFLFERVLKRDMKCGINVKTINKVFPDLVQVYEVMLAEKLNVAEVETIGSKSWKDLPDAYVVEPKLDGLRLNAIKTNGAVTLRTRNGKVLSGYTSLTEELTRVLEEGMVYDGELTSMEFEAGQKDNPDADCFTKLMNDAFSHAENKEGIYNIFDVVPLSMWRTQSLTQPYKERKAHLEETLNDRYENIKLVLSSEVFHKDRQADLTKTVELMYKFLSMGYEGAMVKNIDAPYEFKRTKNLLKMKLMDTIDLEVLEVLEGEGKYEGMLGKVRCEYKGNDLFVGSGWSDEERERYWNNPNLLIGKTIEIAYQNETENKDGSKSLRFPVKKCVREDK